MNQAIRVLFAALTLLAGAARVAEAQAVMLDVTSRDDDLREGGSATLVLHMYDGTEQRTALTHGERLADHSTRQFRVAPQPPYRWSDVTQFGLAVTLHPGDGMMLHQDKWNPTVVLRGTGGSCSNVQPGAACFGYVDASFDFQHNGTQLAAFRVVVGKCENDWQCNGFGPYCGDRVARCAVGKAGANPMGCVKLSAPQPACGGGQVCLESERRCVVSNCQDPDADRDGHSRMECGGDDCDDHDPNRHPGNAEICDDRGHDEDCDEDTFGDRDADHDGHVDARCYNDGRQF